MFNGKNIATGPLIYIERDSRLVLKYFFFYFLKKKIIYIYIIQIKNFFNIYLFIIYLFTNV